MNFVATALAGAWIIELEPIADSRGFFARSFCEQEFADRGLEPRVAQSNVSFNARAGTLRGMHRQRAPHEETKLVRCTAGAIHDVIIDLRPASPTYRRWIAVELTAENRRMLYVPRSFAHGFLTLADDSEVAYHVSHRYTPGAESGIRYDDPVFGIDWPIPVAVLSEKDRGWPPFAD